MCIWRNNDLDIFDIWKCFQFRLKKKKKKKSAIDLTNVQVNGFKTGHNVFVIPACWGKWLIAFPVLKLSYKHT